MRSLTALLFLLFVAAPTAAAPIAAAAAADGAPLDAFLEEFREYQKLLADFEGEIQYHVTREVNEKKQAVNRSYDQVTNLLEQKENQKRIAAIARLREFVRRYPDHPTYTPDAMFRLADLLYEKAQVDYNTAEDNFDREYSLYNRGKRARAPKAPMLSLNEPIVLYKDLIKRFPTFRYIDSVQYLVGYCHVTMDHFDDAIEAYETLVTRYPQSRHVDEGWMRLGELYFDMGEWAKAVDAYAAVMKFSKSKWYELAFYKLAWSHFQNDSHTIAIHTFLDLLDYYAEQGKSQTMADDRTAMLREEVVEYIAKTLAEDDWDGDGLKDEGAGVTRGLSYLSKPRPSNRAILRKYADTLYELHERPKYFESIEIYRAYLRLEDQGQDDPEIQERIIAIHDILGDVDGGIRERRRMSQLYAKGTAWYQANATNATAIAKAEEYVEKFAQEGALALHQSAQKTKVEGQAEGDPGKIAKAETLYRDAAVAYREYLDAYPVTPMLYEMTYYLADALFYSNQYEPAAGYYEKVRDWGPNNNEYREFAANSAIVSYQTHIEGLIEARRLPKWALAKEIEEVEEVESSGKEKKGGIARVTPKTVPPVLLSYIGAIDAYVGRGLNRKDEPDYQGKIAYKAAEVFLRYKNYEEARKRFEAIVDAYPKDLVANYAAANIINTYWEENDIQNVKRWAGLIEEKNIGAPEERKKWKEEIRVFEMGAQFKHAMAALAEKKHVEAAHEFISLVNQNPNFEDADKALINAALALQEAHRYEESAQVFERIVTDPKFKKSKYHQTALYNLAENYKRFFNFDKAIWGYKTLYSKYPTADEARYALFQAAELLEYNQQYDEAAELFTQYVRMYREREESGALSWRVVNIYKKAGDEARLAKAWEAFAKLEYSNPSVSGRVLEAYANLANYYRKRGDIRRAKRFDKKVLEEYASRGFEAGSLESAYAAEAAFKGIDETFEVYRAIKVEGSLEKQGAAIQKKRKLLAQLEQEYPAVFAYRSVDWTIAAYFRMGQTWLLLAKAVFDAPIPETLSIEEQDIYRMQLEDIAFKWESTAVERLEVTAKNARQMNVMNEWTKKTLEALNQYKPTEYPLFKEEKGFHYADLEQ